MTLAEQLLRANGRVWSLGQLDAESLKWLRAGVKAGRLRKSVAWWPFVAYGLSKKTTWEPV